MSTLLLPLIAGYFLNGGVGQMMQPNANNKGVTPPPGSSFIVTQGGLRITTQGGTPLVTG